MALGKQNHLDFTQVSAVLLSSAIDPQLEKINGGVSQSIRTHSANLLPTVSGAAINQALKGHISLEDVAAQMLANEIQTAITPALMHGLDWADEHIFNPSTAQRAQQRTALPVSQRKPANASKNNVHRLPPAQANKPAETPQHFMGRMGIEGELSEFNEVWSDFSESSSESMNSYVPSLYDGSQRQALQNHRSPFWNNVQHWVETKLEEHPGLYKFLQRHEDAVVGVNKALENADVRLYGALRAEAGAGMMVLGGMGGPVGIPLMYLGADNMQAGTYQFLTAKQTQTLTTNQLQRHLHLSDTQAELVDLGLSAGAGGLAVSGGRVREFLGNSRFTMFGSRSNPSVEGVVATSNNRYLVDSRSSASIGTLPVEVVPNNRTIAANHIREARAMLAEAGVPREARNQIINSFEHETFRVVKTSEELTAYRTFDDTGVALKGRYVSTGVLTNQTERITRLALPSNSATRLGTVTIPKGSTIFEGTIAPQLKFDAAMIGGERQLFLTGALDRYSYEEIFMPRHTPPNFGSW